MATLIFRSKSDNRFYSETTKPTGPGTWYVFYYDSRGRKVRKLVGTNKRIAEIARGDIEARLAKQRSGLIDPDQELTRVTIASFCEQLPSFLRADNKAPLTQTRYEGVLRTFQKFLAEEDANIRFLDQIEVPSIERYKDYRRCAPVTRNGHAKGKMRNGVSVRTMNNELMFLRTLFNLAKRRGFVRRNPFDNVRRVEGQKRKHYQPLTKDQIHCCPKGDRFFLRPAYCRGFSAQESVFEVEAP